MKLGLQAHCGYFDVCMKNSVWANFVIHFGPPNESKSRFSIILLKVSCGFTSVLLYILIGATFRDVYNMGLKGPFWEPFWTTK